jgi:hypothetical protein
MSLIVAVPCGLVAAAAHGASTAGQHEAAPTGCRYGPEST